MRWWFSGSFKSFSVPYTIINFLFASFKFLSTFKNAYWKPPLVPTRPLIGFRENAQELICHRWLPGWFYRIAGGFLFCVKITALKGLSHKIDFKNVDENEQILALTRAAAGFWMFRRLLWFLVEMKHQFPGKCLNDAESLCSPINFVTELPASLPPCRLFQRKI